jgi:hypothetical protein
MITFLILVVLALVLAGIGLALLPKRSLPPGSSQFNFSEGPPNGLFGDEVPVPRPAASVGRQALLARAAEGDLATLVEAQAMRDTLFYDSVLNALIERASACQQDFDGLVKRILENGDLPANATLAERVIAQCQVSPGRGRAADTVHLAALSNEAAIFEKAVETILQLWSEGKLPEVSAEELRELFESEYWVLGAEARRAGPGFTLRQRLAEVRRQLATAPGPAPQQKHQTLPEGMKEQHEQH